MQFVHEVVAAAGRAAAAEVAGGVEVVGSAGVAGAAGAAGGVGGWRGRGKTVVHGFALAGANRRGRCRRVAGMGKDCGSRVRACKREPRSGARGAVLRVAEAATAPEPVAASSRPGCIL